MGSREVARLIPSFHIDRRITTVLFVSLTPLLVIVGLVSIGALGGTTEVSSGSNGSVELFGVGGKRYRLFQTPQKGSCMSLQIWRRIPDNQLSKIGIRGETNKNKAIPLHVQNGARPQHAPFRCANGKWVLK